MLILAKKFCGKELYERKKEKNRFDNRSDTDELDHRLPWNAFIGKFDGK